MTFSSAVNRATVTPNSLLLYGDGVNVVGGLRATSVTFINANTAVFGLSGGYSNGGTVVVKVNPGTIKSTGNATIQGYSDSFKIKGTITTAVTKLTTPVTPTATLPPSVSHPVRVVTRPVSVTLPRTIVPSVPYTPPPAAAPTSGTLKTPKGPLSTRKLPVRQEEEVSNPGSSSTRRNQRRTVPCGPSVCRFETRCELLELRGYPGRKGRRTRTRSSENVGKPGSSFLTKFP